MRISRPDTTSRLGVALILAAVLGCGSVGCGSGERDRRDETGAPAADGTRIELIYVDGDSASADGADAAAPESSSPESAAPEPGAVAGPDVEASPSRPPAPTAADEVGGGELIIYDPEGDFTVQVGTFSEAATASRRVRELENLGYPAYAVAHPQGSQVRVRIGYFGSREAADHFAARFRRDHGGNTWIDRRSQEVASR